MAIPTLTILNQAQTYSFLWHHGLEDVFSASQVHSLGATTYCCTQTIGTEQQVRLQEDLELAAQSAVRLTEQGSGTPSTAALQALTQLGRRLFTQYLPPTIQGFLQALPPASPLVIATNAASLPWELLHDETGFLSLRLALSRQLITDRVVTQPRRTPQTQRHCLIIANPTGDLAMTDNEVEALLSLFETAPYPVHPQIVVRGQATKARLETALISGHYDIIHYAGHARPDGLHLADGWFSMAEIPRNFPGAPLIFLNACNSAGASNTSLLPYDGSQLNSLAGAFLHAGASAFIGTLWPVFDVGAQHIAGEFYRLLLQGESIATALNHARLAAWRQSAHNLLWASFLLYGHPALRLAPAAPRQSVGSVLVVERMSDGGEADTGQIAIPAHHAQWLQILTTYGSTVVQQDVTRLVALFGLPHTLEDDAIRAARAALAMIDTLPIAQRPTVRIGIASGSITLTHTLHDHHQAVHSPSFVTGAAIQEAALLVRQADAGAIVIAAETAQLAADQLILTPTDLFARAEATGEAALRAYQLVGQRTDEAMTVIRTLSQPLIQSAPRFVGRQQELATLQQAWQAARQGHGRIIGIQGEPGIGKSRLVRALRQNLPDEDYSYLATVDSSLSNDAPYGFLRQLLDGVLSAWLSYAHAQGDNVDVVREHTTAPLTAKVVELAQQLLDTFHEAGARAGTVQDHQFQRSRQIQLLRRLLASVAGSKPLLLVLDNLHRADVDSLEIIAQAADGIGRMPILLLALYRPLWENPWLHKSEHQLLSLLPLDPLSAAQLVQELLNTPTLPTDLREIPTRGHGNPLWVIEIVRTLVESRRLVKRDESWALKHPLAVVELPTSVHRLLLMRVSHLATELHEVLQVATILGDAVLPALLAAILHRTPEQITAQLDRLVGHELLKARWAEGDYVFQQTTLREVVYDHFALERRQLYHRRTAEFLMHQHGESAEQISLIARHFDQSDDTLNALLYCMRAAEQAAEQWANNTAWQWYARVLAHLAQPINTPAYINESRRATLTSQQLEQIHLDATEGYATALALVGRSAEAIEQFHAALGLLGNINPDTGERFAELYRKLAIAYHDHAKMAEAQQMLNAGLAALGNGESEAAGRIYLWQGIVHFRRGEPTAADAACQRAVELLQQTKNQRDLAQAYNLQGVLYRPIGRRAEAIAALQASIALYTELNHLSGLGRAYHNLGCVYDDLSDWGQAYYYFEESARLAQETDEERRRAASIASIGEIHRRRGAWTEAQTAYEEAYEIAQRLDQPELLATFQMNLGAVYLGQGALAAAEDALQTSSEIFQQTQVKTHWAEIWRLQAEVALAQDRLPEAQALAHQALAWAQEQQEVLAVGTSYRLLGQIAAAAAQWTTAIDALEQSRALLQAENSRYEHAQTLLALAEVLLRSTDASSSEPLPGDESTLPRALALCEESTEIFSALDLSAVVTAAQQLRAALLHRLR